MVNLQELTDKQRQRYQRILDIAGNMFIEKGFSATSMAEICQQVGGSKATLYSYFSSKEELFEAFMLDEIESRIKTVFSLPEQTANPDKTLYELGMRFIDLRTQQRAIAVYRLAENESRIFPQIGTIFYENGPARSNAILTGFIDKACKENHLDAEDPGLAAAQFLMLCQAELTLPYHFGVRGEPSETEKARIIQAAVDTFMARFGPKPDTDTDSP